MKKMLALLGLVLALSVIESVPAFPTLLYRTKFRPSTGCLDRGWLTDRGVNTDIPNNPAFTYIIFPGDTLELIQNGTCCDGQQRAMGYTWVEVSGDNGSTWSLVSPTFVQLMMPANTIMESYALSPTGIGTLGPLHHILNCDGSTGP